MPDDEQIIGAGYDLVYGALPSSATFARVWREHALGADFPAGFEHISFFTHAELEQVKSRLGLSAGETLLDLGCGMGGPGAWIAKETGARIIGVDLSAVALRHAQARADGHGVAARYVRGSFAATGLDDACGDGAISGDALQYAPDKRAALREIARVLRPGRRFVFACFEVEAAKVRGMRVFGTDPVEDYAPLLEEAGFAVEAYDETPGWRERVRAAYQGCIDARAGLAEEMGEAAASALLSEMTLTLEIEPYRRRVLVSAAKR